MYATLLWKSLRFPKIDKPLVVYRFYCMGLFYSQTRRHMINEFICLSIQFSSGELYAVINTFKNNLTTCSFKKGESSSLLLHSWKCATYETCKNCTGLIYFEHIMQLFTFECCLCNELGFKLWHMIVDF